MSWLRAIVMRLWNGFVGLFRPRLPPPEEIVADRRLERRLAVVGQVPRRCGLCRSFVHGDMNDTFQTNPAFAQAAKLLGPRMMGALKGQRKPMPVGSEAARELRPDLQDRWEDYGGCARWPGLGVWAYAEEPEIGEDFSMGEPPGPCKVWR